MIDSKLRHVAHEHQEENVENQGHNNMRDERGNNFPASREKKMNDKQRKISAERSGDAQSSDSDDLHTQLHNNMRIGKKLDLTALLEAIGTFLTPAVSSLSFGDVIQNHHLTYKFTIC